MIGNLTESQIDEVLRSEVTGRIAYVADGWPHIVPVTYVYNGEGYVFSHSAEGHKTTWMRKNPNVGFEVEQVRSLSDWRTVFARGVFEELARDQDEAMMDFIARQFAWGPPGARTNERHEDVHRREGIVRPVLFRIRLTERTGRFEFS